VTCHLFKRRVSAHNTYLRMRFLGRYLLPREQDSPNKNTRQRHLTPPRTSLHEGLCIPCSRRGCFTHPWGAFGLDTRDRFVPFWFSFTDSVDSSPLTISPFSRRVSRYWRRCKCSATAKWRGEWTTRRRRYPRFGDDGKRNSGDGGGRERYRRDGGHYGCYCY